MDQYLADLAPDPALFVTNLQDAENYYAIFAYCFLKVYLVFTSLFTDKMSKKSQSDKTVGIKVFLTIFALRWKDPDPGRPKTYAPYGSRTLLARKI